MNQRGPGKPFPKGRSGNPGGRPRAELDVQELARAHTPDAIAALVAALTSPRERVAAATALLDRAWGRPTQHVGGDAGGAPLCIDFRWADAVQPAEPETPEPEVLAAAGAAEFAVVWADDAEAEPG